MMKNEMHDYYQTLGVSKSASSDEIKKAYRKKAQKYHPDLVAEDEKKKAKEEFQKVQQAYDVLKDPEKRKMYDQLGPDFERMGGGQPYPGGNPFGGGQGSFDFRDLFGQAPGGTGGGGGGGFGFEDILRQFAPNGGGGGRQRRHAGGGAAKGRDIQQSVTIPFAVSVNGGEASVAIQRGGSPQTIKVKIPAGIESGKKIRLRGQGEPSMSGSAAGDLILSVTVAEHPCYRRQGDNLVMTLPVSIPEAIRGARIDVPTPEGTVTVSVPPASSSGKKLRLRGLGIKRNDARGDLILELSIVVPESLKSDLPENLAKALEQWPRHEPRQHLRW